MDKKISILSGIYIMFLVLLFVSGSFSGVLSEIIYFASFIFPFCFAIFLTKEEKIPFTKYLRIDKRGITVTTFTVFPTVMLVLLTSLVTAFMIEKLTGVTNQVVLEHSIAFAIINHAVLPVLLEEMMFRYLPMRMLSGHSRMACVFVSAFFFSLVHHDLFSIPYAFAAGVVFMMINLMCNSVIPSLIIHLINNLISVLLIFYAENPLIKLVILALLIVCTLISVVFILAQKNKYKEMVKSAFIRGEKMKFNFSMLIFAVVCLLLAVFGLT